MGYTLSGFDLKNQGFSDREVLRLGYWRKVAESVEQGGENKVSWPSQDYHPVVYLQPEIIHERLYISGFDFMARCGLDGITSCKTNEINCARCIVIARALSG